MPACILIIDDNPASLDLMAYVIHAFGYGLLTARDGITGLALSRHKHPDLIVCDLDLPGMDGRAIVRQCKTEEALRAIPVIAVTASAMAGDRDDALASGFTGYISK